MGIISSGHYQWHWKIQIENKAEECAFHFISFISFPVRQLLTTAATSQQNVTSKEQLQ
jgi:hypothetical protein